MEIENETKTEKTAKFYLSKRHLIFFPVLFALVVLAGILLSLSMLTHAQSDNPTDNDELVALSQEWMQALERKDRNRLEQILHKDFLILGIEDADAPTDREQWLRNGLEDSDWLAFRYDNMHATRLGDVAIVRSTLDFTAERRSGLIRKVSTTAPLVDVWVRHDGRWQVVRRYVAPWTARRWADRGLGFLIGLVVLVVISSLWRRRPRRTKAVV